MLYHQALLGLFAAATVSAIDLEMHWHARDCNGRKGQTWTTWKGATPDKCYFKEDAKKNGYGATSIALRAIDTKWNNVNVIAYNTYDCSWKPIVRTEVGNKNQPDLCGGTVGRTVWPGSAKYVFDDPSKIHNKRWVGRPRAEASSEPCKRSPMPDFLSIGDGGDGVHYNVTGLDVDALHKIDELHRSGAELPEEFKRRMVTRDVVEA